MTQKENALAFLVFLRRNFYTLSCYDKKLTYYPKYYNRFKRKSYSGAQVYDIFKQEKAKKNAKR